MKKIENNHTLINLLNKDKFELISIGYNCFIKKFLNIELLIENKTNFFDYIGSSMWGINELFENDFVDFTNEQNYENIQIEKNKKCNYLTNTQYYLRFKHDLNINIKLYDDFYNKYIRRKKRLYDILI